MKSQKLCITEKDLSDGVAEKFIDFQPADLSAKVLALVKAKAGGLCLPRSKLCFTTRVRVGGNEEDYEMIHK